MLLWLHAAGLTLFGLTQGVRPAHAVGEGALIALTALLASTPRLGRPARSAIGALGLVTTSAVFVHLSGGVIEVHFHFFVMVGLLSLYQEWQPFLVAIGYVVVHHGVLGVVAPDTVYDHPDAVAEPWKWAVIHGVFVLAASVANVVAWRLNEEATAELHASEERFRQVFENAGVGIVTVDLDGRFTDANASFVAITGYAENELLGMSPEDITHPDDRRLVRDAMGDLFSGDVDALEVEFRYVRKDGRVVHVSASGSAVYAANGTIDHLVGVIQDISDRRRAEEELRLLSTVSLAVADADDFDTALEVAVEELCRATGWAFGQVWLPTEERDTLALAPIWTGAAPAFEAFHTASADQRFARGEGLPGRAWATGSSVWIRDLADDANFPRSATAREVGLTSAMAVPITTGESVLGVLEFFQTAPREEDERLLTTAVVVAGQLGNLLQRKRAEAAHREAEQQYRTTLETAHNAFVAIDADGIVVDWNERAEATFGWTAEEAIGRLLAEMIIPPTYRRLHAAGLQRFLATEQGKVLNQRLELSALRRDGSEFPVAITIWAIELGGQWRFNAFLEDITEQAAARQALLDSEERYRSIVETAQEGVWLFDTTGRTTFVNSKLSEMLGYPSEEMVGRPATEFADVTDAAAVIAHLGGGPRTGVDRAELRLRTRDGALLWAVVSTSAVAGGVLAMVSDITERKVAEEALAHQAFHDDLTGLPNRALFLDRLGHALTRRTRTKRSTAVLFLDLDRFKWVNDSLGHAAGDTVLQAAAERLCNVVRAEDTVARFGGDEFAVLCEDLRSETDAVVVAQRIVDAVSEPIVVEGRNLTLTVSVGIAMADDPLVDADILLRDADSAMYRAKERGRDRIELFDEAMRERAMARLEIETELRRALDNRELCVHFQPVVGLSGEQVVGVEALVRWQHPGRGLVPPMEFIPIAEDTGLIVPLGAFVLEEACRTIAAWNAEHPDRRPLSVAVNLSARQLSSAGLRDVVARALSDSGLPAELLCLEITESVLMEDADASREQLHALKGLGVTLGVDDFGTGYSSLLYLRRFPVDVIKIDRSFVSGLGTSAEDGAIVAGVVQLAKALGLQSVAEGVELPDQVQRLDGLGCDLAQGFYWSPAVDADELAAWLERSVPKTIVRLP
jgi:diguanylate cyclase (GGDEF)-like protein/PAS domain S-box-containing protein